MSAAPKWPFEVQRETYRQGNWKRRYGVATHHEVTLAIERMLERGELRIAGGELQEVRSARVRVEPISREERWRREDEELRIQCQQVTVNETVGVGGLETIGDIESQGFLIESHALRSEPRRTVRMFVLRELRHPEGARGYDAIVSAISEKGGFDWVLGEPRVVGITGKAGKRQSLGRK